MESFVILAEELWALLHAKLLLVTFCSTCAGIIIGAMPGLTATMGVALLTGLTYNMPTAMAIPVLLGIYVGAVYGGSITAVLINIPGTPSSAATALDGYPLARQGNALRALNLTRYASFLGTIIGVVCLFSFSNPISRIAERHVASPEYFMLAVFGVLICGTLTATDRPVKGWIAGMIGLMISFIGMEEIHGYQRFTFGSMELMSGIAFIPAMIGIFGVPQILDTLKNPDEAFIITDIAGSQDKWGFFDYLRMVKKYARTIVRGGLLGVGIGSIPGVGEDIAAWMSYDRAKKASKEKELFGKGSYEGVIASEVGNNACIGGAIIPLLTLAVPGSPPAAVLLGALYLHNIRPGPMIHLEFPRLSYHMTAVILIASFTLLIGGLILTSVMVHVLRIKPALLMPIVSALSVIGAFAIGARHFDLYVMLVFGFAGFALNAMGFPPAPLILGMILGPIADGNFRRTLLASDGSILPFFTRPISLLFVILIALTLMSQFGVVAKLFGKRDPAAADPPPAPPAE
ncbi:MAG: tripartite tricarboxylate transporter permease [Planctomycetes bacterium]|nr:tripartite tricarboxylate transporter permease [Planctomycetota bacterium]